MRGASPQGRSIADGGRLGNQLVEKPASRVRATRCRGKCLRFARVQWSLGGFADSGRRDTRVARALGAEVGGYVK